MATIRYNYNKPLFYENDINNWFWKNKEDFNKYIKYIFSENNYIDIGVKFLSWNKIKTILDVNFLQFHENINQLYYFEIKLQENSKSQYYWLNNYTILQNNKIALELTLDIWTTYFFDIKFKIEATADILRLHLSRWRNDSKENYSIFNFTSNSHLYFNDPLIEGMKNNINQKQYFLNKNEDFSYYFFDYTPILKGMFIYAVCSYEDLEKAKGESNYHFDFINKYNQKTIPMPFYIIPITNDLLNNNEERNNFSKIINSPYLISLMCSDLPWFTDPSRYPYENNNNIVFTHNWKEIYGENLPQEIKDLKTKCFRTDLIHSRLTSEFNNNDFSGGLKNCFNEKLPIEIIEKWNVRSKKTTEFNPDYEPKLYMYPFFEIELIRGKRTTLKLYNELLCANWDLKNILFPIIQSFTPYSVLTLYIANNGFYKTSLLNGQYCLEASGSNTLVSLSSSYKQFLNQHLSAYNTGLKQQQSNQTADILKTMSITGAGAIGGAVAGTPFGPLGMIGGSLLGGLFGLFSGGKQVMNDEFEIQKTKNQLTDLARTPDNINNFSNDPYLDIELMRNDGLYYKTSLRTKELTENNRYQVAMYFHKFGYMINKKLKINKWDDLIIRENWNYIQIEKISDIIDNNYLPLSVITWLNDKFKNGFRLWNYNNDNYIDVYNYLLPNNEIDYPPYHNENLISSENDITGLPTKTNLTINNLKSSLNDLIIKEVKKKWIK